MRLVALAWLVALTIILMWLEAFPFIVVIAWTIALLLAWLISSLLIIISWTIALLLAWLIRALLVIARVVSLLTILLTALQSCSKSFWAETFFAHIVVLILNAWTLWTPVGAELALIARRLCLMSFMFLR